MSDAIMAEIKRVLRLKFKWPDEDALPDLLYQRDC